MTIKLTLRADSNIILPFSYNRIIQAVLYNMINEDSFASFIHDRGYTFDKRCYKLFSFSDIQEKPVRVHREEKKLEFSNFVTIYVSSIGNEFLNYVFEKFIGNGQTVRLGNTQAVISEIKKVPINIESKMTVQTLSPVTIYTTLTEPVKKTYYYSPVESQFSTLIKNNLIKKHFAYYGSNINDAEFSIKACGRAREVYTSYKGFVIKGYKGRFEISGSPELIQMAFDAGIGGKNAQGYGLIVPEKI